MKLIDRKKRVSILATSLLAGAMTGLICGCSQTVAAKPSVAETETGQPSAAVSGFFGSDYSLLQPGGKDEASMIYINPNAQWSQYNKILLEPVEFRDDSGSNVSPSDQLMLTGYFYNKLKEDMQKHFTLVDQGGSGVLVAQFALTNATAATPGLRSVSVAIPQARILNGIQSLATGSYAFVGSAEVEMKATDAVTGQLLAAAIDKREGGMALSSAAQWRWGDAENAMNYWSEKATKRLLQLQGRAVAEQ